MNEVCNLIDSHCHFDFPIFDKDREAIWSECNHAGITRAIIPGVSFEQWSIAAALCDAYVGIYYAVGLHPWWIQELLMFNDEVTLCEKLQQQLLIAAQTEKCLAIGECGLDAMIDTPMNIQQAILDVHLQVAKKLAMPVIIHCRKTHNELMSQLKAHKEKNNYLTGVIHGFSGSVELAQQYWSLGFYIGVGGTITYERANKTREMVRQLPLEAILLETDSPDMPLQGRQGQRNNPQAILEIANELAQLRGESLQTIATQTSFNAKKLFGFSVETMQRV